LYVFLMSLMTVMFPVHFILPASMTVTIFSESYEVCSSSQFSFLQPLVTSSLLGPNIYSLQHPILIHPRSILFP
jgi:hypothetical protein